MLIVRRYDRRTMKEVRPCSIAQAAYHISRAKMKHPKKFDTELFAADLMAGERNFTERYLYVPDVQELKQCT